MQGRTALLTLHFHYLYLGYKGIELWQDQLKKLRRSEVRMLAFSRRKSRILSPFREKTSWLLRTPITVSCPSRSFPFNNGFILVTLWQSLIFLWIVKRKTYPSVKIGRLAVSKDYDNKGVGRAILDFIKHAFTNGNRTGCRFITVDAYATSSR